MYRYIICEFSVWYPLYVFQTVTEIFILFLNYYQWLAGVKQELSDCYEDGYDHFLLMRFREHLLDFEQM